MTKLKRFPRRSALMAAVVATLLVTMAGSGLAAPGDTTLVSVGSSGEQGNVDSWSASISADGRYVAFASSADNLVEGDTNGVVDVFVRDLQAGTTERVSVDNYSNQQNDQQQRDGDTFCGLDISADGRYVAFSSAADNLVPNDTNAACDIFVRDLQEGTTERVSIHASGEQANGDSWQPAISADGRYVAFHHGPDDLAGSNPDERYDVYVRDLQAGTTERVSIDSSGNPINGSSVNASISADGRYVSFFSDGINVVPNDSGGGVYVRDLQEETTRKVSVAISGEQASSGDGYSSISADGRYVAFQSGVTNLVPDDTNGEYDIFVRDLQEGTTKRVSVATSGEQANSYSDYPSISANGRYVAFDSSASNLIPNDSGGGVYVHDLQEGKTEKVSVDSFGNTANGETFNSSLSTDGRYIAFSSYADNLVPGGDANGSGAEGTGSDVFVHERRAQDGTPPDTTTPPYSTPPIANIVTPSDGAIYVRNETVDADYSCEDEAGGSGLESCEGTVAKGQPIDTGSLGTRTFTVRATDNAGNESSITHTYTVAECTITGTPDDDVLEGTAGSDRICGLGDDDTLEGLGGDDELVGGLGDDTLDGGPGTDTADFAASPAGVTASLVTNRATGDGSDLMVGIENLIGSNHDDTFIGSGSKNYLFGRSGVDQLFGLEGADTLIGGAQDDALRGGAGTDHLVANGGADDLFGEAGADSLDSRDGVEGNDAVDGGADADVCSTDRIEEWITNCEQHQNIPPTPDTAPPNTTSTLSPKPNAAGWNDSNVTVTLDATDDDSGVKEITYSMNGGADQTYDPTTRILVSSQGTTTISYFATDNAGNQESPAKSLTVKVDKSAPTIDAVTPADGQTGVSRDIAPTATFSDEMNLASLTTSVKLYLWNALKKEWQRVPATASLEATRVVLDPYGDTEQLLAANSRYRVTVTTGARNLAGIPMSSPRSWIFTTEDTSGEATSVPPEGTPGEAMKGRIVFSSDRNDRSYDIYAVDADGSNLSQLTDTVASDFDPTWSPDGTQIAFANPFLYTMDADGSNLLDLTSGFSIHHAPTWSPDGATLAFEGEETPGEYHSDIYTMDIASLEMTNLTNSPGVVDINPEFSPDGSQLCFHRSGAEPGSGIYTMNVDGSDLTRLVDEHSATGFGVAGCDWSPDGSKIAYAYLVDGVEDVYVMNADGSGKTNLTKSPGRDISPSWSPDGTRIAFARSWQGDFDIYTMDADGSNLTSVTDSPSTADINPDWQPPPETATP